MLRIGLTGGIGTGKTVVSDKFKLFYNIPIIDADIVTRSLMQVGTEAYNEIVKAFGTAALTNKNEIDRKFLRQVVFSNQEKRIQLEDIIHPKVRNEIIEWVATLSGPYCLIVIPLLLESNMQSIVDKILVVDTHRQHQLERVAQRDQCSADHVQKIINSQIDADERLRHADDIIANNGNLSDLDEQIHQLHEKYLALSS